MARPIKIIHINDWDKTPLFRYILAFAAGLTIGYILCLMHLGNMMYYWNDQFFDPEKTKAYTPIAKFQLRAIDKIGSKPILKEQ